MFLNIHLKESNLRDVKNSHFNKILNNGRGLWIVPEHEALIINRDVSSNEKAFRFRFAFRTVKNGSQLSSDFWNNCINNEDSNDLKASKSVKETNPYGNLCGVFNDR